MPNTRKVHWVLSVAAGSSAQKRQGRAVTIASHHCRKSHVPNPQGGPHVLRRAPGGPVVAGHGSHGMTIAIVPSEKDRVIGAYCDRRITVGRRAARYGVDSPGQPVVPGDNHGLGPAAVLVGNISRAVWTDLDVAMQAGTRRQGIDG